MDRGALRSFVARTRALVDPAPPATLEETRTWIVEPLLETLGWDIRSDTNACEVEMDRSLGGAAFEYVFSIDGTPGLFVAAESFTDDLSTRRERALRRAMQASGVDRTIYTNGRKLVLLAGPSGLDRFQCRLSSLHDAESELEHVSFQRTERRLERHSRAFAARRLAVERETLTDSIVDDLAALAGESYRAELRTATERFVDELIRGFTTDSAVSGPDALERRSDQGSDRNRRGHDRDSVTLEREQSDVPSSDGTGDSRVGFDDSAVDGSPPDEPMLDDAPSPAANGEDGSNSSAVEGDDREGDIEDTGVEDGDSEDSRSRTTGTDDREYVVRFFNDRGSVGAIGHSQPEQAMVHAAEYLLDRGLGDLELPWAPADDVTVLNDEPTLEAGSPMAAAEGLSNGYVLNTGGSLEERARRIAALAEEAGLRAMLTGDWPEVE